MKCYLIDGPEAGKTVETGGNHNAYHRVAVYSPPSTAAAVRYADVSPDTDAVHYVEYTVVGRSPRDSSLYYMAVWTDTRDDEVNRLRKECDALRKKVAEAKAALAGRK